MISTALWAQQAAFVSEGICPRCRVVLERSKTPQGEDCGRCPECASIWRLVSGSSVPWVPTDDMVVIEGWTSPPHVEHRVASHVEKR